MAGSLFFYADGTLVSVNCFFKKEFVSVFGAGDAAIGNFKADGFYIRAEPRAFALEKSLFQSPDFKETADIFSDISDFGFGCEFFGNPKTDASDFFDINADFLFGNCTDNGIRTVADAEKNVCIYGIWLAVFVFCKNNAFGSCAAFFGNHTPAKHIGGNFLFLFDVGGQRKNFGFLFLVHNGEMTSQRFFADSVNVN